MTLASGKEIIHEKQGAGMVRTMCPKVGTAILAAGAFASVNAQPASAEPSPTRAKAISTVEFLMPLVIDGAYYDEKVLNCTRYSTPAGTWRCDVQWKWRNAWSVTACRNKWVMNEPDWVYAIESRAQCNVRSTTATRARH